MSEGKRFLGTDIAVLLTGSMSAYSLFGLMVSMTGAGSAAAIARFPKGGGQHIADILHGADHIIAGNRAGNAGKCHLGGTERLRNSADIAVYARNFD